MQSDLNKGKLVRWNDDRGFGFIQPIAGGKDVFLHISVVKTKGRRPVVGDTIFYQVVTDADGKVRASTALIQGVVSQIATTQRAKPAATKPKKKSKLTEVILSIGAFSVLILLQRQFGSSQVPPPLTAVTKPDCVIKGNVSVATGKKLYHVPGMEDYDQTVISPDKGEKWFCSEAEASAAGWSKAPMSSINQ